VKAYEGYFCKNKKIDDKCNCLINIEIPNDENNETPAGKPENEYNKEFETSEGPKEPEPPSEEVILQ